MEFEMVEEKAMRRALELARRGLGRTSPNPMVGAVVMKRGRTIGEGYHLYDRRDHAEAIALREAGNRARGADLFVSLEPCCHQGRTPPCTTTIRDSGVKRVFVSVLDPNPLVRGRGVQELTRHGLEVHVGLLERDACRLNEAFFHYIQRRQPFVTLKLALTLDGKIATASGESKWITGPAARRRVHRDRLAADAILVGINTVLKDDPSLDVRTRFPNSITKVILDSNLRCPPDSRLFGSDEVLIFYSKSRPLQIGRELRNQATLIGVPEDHTGLSWHSILEELGRREITSLIVEGGATVAGSVLATGAVQRIAFFYGPLILGAEGLSGVGNLGLDRLEDTLQLSEYSLRRLGTDFLLDGRISGIPDLRMELPVSKRVSRSEEQGFQVNSESP